MNPCKAHNVFKPSLPSPSGHLADSISPASIKVANEAIIDDVNFKHVCNPVSLALRRKPGNETTFQCSKNINLYIVRHFSTLYNFFATKNYPLYSISHLDASGYSP